MENLIVPCVVGGSAAFIIYSVISLLQVGRRPKDLPPGPPTIPILGNMHLIPKERPHVQFQKWAEEYGPVYSLMLGTRTYIVLSSPTSVKELLDKRSAIYSSRPDMYLGQDVVSSGRRFVIMKYGERWRSIHRMMHVSLNVKTAVAYIPYQDLENKDMLMGFLNDPENFLKHVRRYTNSLTTQMVFGFRTISMNDERLLQFFENFEEWGRIVSNGSAQLLDLFPLLRNLPAFLSPAYRNAKQLSKDENALYLKHWMEAKEKIMNGTCHPCFSYDVLKAQKAEGFSDESAGYITGSLLEGGSDTTSGILVGFIQAMMLFPEVQKLAQEHIDRVVGPDRLPTLDDADELQYIRAIVKESIRWMPTVILGVPHSNIKEDNYMGYRIPVGSTIVNNVWALNMDPKRNPNPRVFDPTRFENDFQTEHESATNKDENQRQNWIFGGGRRMCQGMHIAERSLFLGVSRLLWAFTFKKPLDADGIPITPDADDLVGGITVQPADFKVVITPRSKERADIIQKEWRFCEENILDPHTKQWIKVPDGMKFSAYEPEKA